MNLEPAEFLSISDGGKQALKDARVALVENLVGSDQNQVQTILQPMQRGDEIYLKQLASETLTESCFDLFLQKDREQFWIGSEKLRTIMDGGFRTKSITEICGLPGSGKTQFCMQLCAFCQLPENVGKLSLYIDTNFGFTQNRYREICSSNGITSDIGPMVMRILSASQLIAAIKSMRDLLCNNENIKLVIIDSFSRPFLFKQTSSMLLSAVLMELQELALEFNLVVVITSQMTSKQTMDQSTKHQSTLRSSYSYYVNERLTLWQREQRQEIIFSKKSNIIGSANYQIKLDGLIVT
ncbi:DNA repair protein RAD51 homolog 3-like [Cloeon dipterum]|uniref:DNA repair protein RAD51 homolog 3-like n=1 Tax=Cloeon dipterum TaxID=197152 RepID=UPI003220302B